MEQTFNLHKGANKLERKSKHYQKNWNKNSEKKASKLMQKGTLWRSNSNSRNDCTILNKLTQEQILILMWNNALELTNCTWKNGTKRWLNGSKATTLNLTFLNSKGCTTDQGKKRRAENKKTWNWLKNPKKSSTSPRRPRR